MQVSMSKKWASKPAQDDDGQVLRSKSGKPVLKKSYSVLQDDFFHHMKAAGYTDVERGERRSSEEHLTVPRGVEVYEINGPYFFGIATKFEELMAQLGDRPKVRVIRMRKVPFIDSTGIHNLTNLCVMSRREKIEVVLSGVNDTVHAALQRSGFYELLGPDNICPNINAALERARRILGE